MGTAFRFLGIDYGTKRIGLAVSDENRMLAFPLAILPSNAGAVEELQRIVEEENIREIIVGDSTNFLGKPNPVSKKIESFVSSLRGKLGIPIHMQKEFLTSVEARRSREGKKDRDTSKAHSRIKKIKNGPVDNSAAALILQRYMDRLNNKK